MLEKDFYRLQKLIDENGGIENFRVFAMMPVITTVIPMLGLVACGNEHSWAECFVDERRYKVEDGYKITLIPISQNFASRDFYQCDFASLMRSGNILVKTSENQIIKHEKWIEPLTDNAYLVHEGDCLSEEP